MVTYNVPVDFSKFQTNKVRLIPIPAVEIRLKPDDSSNCITENDNLARHNMFMLISNVVEISYLLFQKVFSVLVVARKVFQPAYEHPLYFYSKHTPFEIWKTFWLEQKSI